MAKIKTSYFCNNCGTQHSQWMGKCNQCLQWNTLQEEVISKPNSTASKIPAFGLTKSKKNAPTLIQEIKAQEEDRIKTHIGELDRVLGGGIVNGSVTLIGGEPGIGKSTLMLQLALKLKKLKILYVSGEESETQIKLRADRIDDKNQQCYILSEADTAAIFTQINHLEPELVIIDSIQTLKSPVLESTPGTVSQIRQSASELIQYAKVSDIPIFIIGHINKEGSIAGPKILEHMVDVVLQFEGNNKNLLRMLRAQKNRFGSTNELGIFEMTSKGLEEITNPSEILLNNKDVQLNGNAICVITEGNRPIFVEVQALVSHAVYGTPQRSSTGYDVKRLNMILAVLEKRGNIKTSIKDIFLNITGGLQIKEPSIDLGVVASIVSSFLNIDIPNQYCFAAEIGLNGEVRPVPMIHQRIKEAEKLGYTTIFISKQHKTLPKTAQIKAVQLTHIEDFIRHIK